MVHEATAIGLRVTSSVEEVVSSASLATWHSMSSTEVILMERQRERVLIVVHGSVSGKLIEAHRKGETRIKPCRLEEEERFRTPLQSPWWAKRRSLAWSEVRRYLTMTCSQWQSLLETKTFVYHSVCDCLRCDHQEAHIAS